MNSASVSDWYPTHPLTGLLLSRAIDHLLDRSESLGVDLSVGDARTIATRMQAIYVKDGQSFRLGGSEPLKDVILLVLVGEASLQLHARERAPIAMTSTVQEGEFLGLVSTLGKAIPPTLIRVNCDAALGSLSKSTLKTLASAHPRTYGALMHLFACDLATRGADFLGRIVVLDRLNRGLKVELYGDSPSDAGQHPNVGNEINDIAHSGEFTQMVSTGCHAHQPTYAGHTVQK